MVVVMQLLGYTYTVSYAYVPTYTEFANLLCLCLLLHLYTLKFSLPIVYMSTYSVLCT